MKKIFAFLMIVSVMGAVLAGCGSKAEEPAKTDGAAAPATTEKQ